MNIAGISVVVALLVIAIPLISIAKRFNVSYPIVLVLGGVVLGFVPGLPNVPMDPDIVLLVFLPPLLYWEAITAPTDAMRDNAGQIGVLAFGLVIATTIAVAAVAHAIIPGMSWAVAFVLGAIVSPTDELAAVPVLERFRLPRHVIAIIEGESLLNDAAALVLYATAITVVATGAFHPLVAPFAFLGTVAGSLLIGFVAARLAIALWRRISDPQLQGIVSVILPFMAYLPAQAFGLSGVLAVIMAGVYANRLTPRVLTPAARQQLGGFWSMAVFLVNALVFLLVGLQLHGVATSVFRHAPWEHVIAYAVAVNVTLVVVRLVLVVVAEYAPTAAPPDHALPNWRNALAVAWSGLRGGVSLAAALAIPIALPNQTAFPHRELLIFITFSVILVTLVGGGLTLPLIIHGLGITGGNEEQEEMRLGELRASEAALAKIDELASDGRIDAEHATSLRHSFEHRRDVKLRVDAGSHEHRLRHRDAEREIIDAQRQALIEMREHGEIDNVVLHRLLTGLDLALAQGTLVDEKEPGPKGSLT